MLDLFRKKLWLVERSTRIHYPTLVEFVEVWNRRVAGSLPASVAERMGHNEENLDSLYEDTERHRDQLQRILKARRFHQGERPQGSGEEAGPQRDPIMIGGISAHSWAAEAAGAAAGVLEVGRK